jgi:hypothetical protein
MALPEKRAQAKRLYVDKAMTCSAIAHELAVDVSTVYRWKSEATDQGDAQDWEYQRQVQAVSFDKLKSVFREAICSAISKIEENPAGLLEPKVADALAKIMKSAEKIDPRTSYLGVAADLIKVENRWLAEHEPAIKAQLDPCWDGIYQELVNYFTRGLL